MYDWSGLWWIQSPSCPTVSVVVERMYDWSNEERKMNKQIENRFSCCWKDVRLKRPQRHTAPAKEMFQLLLKGCTIEATSDGLLQVSVSFQLLLKGCTIEAVQSEWSKFNLVSVVVERMYDWSKIISTQKRLAKSFSCCWKDVRLKQTADSFQVRGEGFQLLLKGCTIEASLERLTKIVVGVSVVVERMYDWSSETNWLKTNDFWQLVSDLFFENGRSAQKVPLFSKIWGDLGDCLTVFDSYSNI